jgi:hypothetical protein
MSLISDRPNADVCWEISRIQWLGFNYDFIQKLSSLWIQSYGMYS